MSYDIIKFADGILHGEYAGQEFETKSFDGHYERYFVEKDGTLIKSLDGDGMIRPSECDFFTGDVVIDRGLIKACFVNGQLKEVFEAQYARKWVQIYPRLEEEQA